MKPIRLSQHAQQKMRDRGATEQEVLEAIRENPWEPAELGRMECRRDFKFGRDWKGRVYATKQVRPIFVEQAGDILVVTVYVYYF